MIRQSDIKVDSVYYHRNGCAGEGFWRVGLRFRQGRSFKPLLAVLFDAGDGDDDCGKISNRCAVIDPLDGKSRWRGDDFEPLLRPHLVTAMNADSGEAFS